MFPVFVVVLLIAESWPCHSCGLVRGGEDELEEARADPEKSLSRRRGEEALTGHLPSAEGLSLKSLWYSLGGEVARWQRNVSLELSAAVMSRLVVVVWPCKELGE